MSTTSTIGWRHLHWEATDSTNNRAAEFADDPANHGIVCTADVQVQGRGQHGRRWHSAPGANLLLSVLLFPPPPLCRPPVLTGLTALAVQATVQTYVTQPPRLKWPNDILVQQKKMGGILIESGVRPGQSNPYFVIGLGLNINATAREFAAHNLPNASSLRILADRELLVSDVRATLLAHLDREYQQALHDLADTEARWAAAFALLHHTVTVERMDASEVQGTLLELTFDRVTLLQTATSVSLRPEEIRHIR